MIITVTAPGCRGPARSCASRISRSASSGGSPATSTQSEPGTVYTIERTPAGWACSCEGFAFTGMCKHLGAVERRAEREGWPFGAIAPLSRVARYFPLDLPENVARRGAVLAVTPAPAPAADLDALRERGRRAKADLYGTAAD